MARTSPDRLEDKLTALLGEQVLRLDAATGGDINQAYALTLASGRRLFAKTHATALPQVFVREAEGLAWLAAAKALRVPAVIATCNADERGPACLVLELIAVGSRNRSYDETLGRGLAALHRCGAPSFGFETANYLATLVQDNRPVEAWPEFYAQRRLMPLCERARQRGVLPASSVTRLERVCASMGAFAGDPEPPARLHGDLWGGNVLAADSGEPVLIDPAVYGGHREVDLAMMRLFGGFSRRVFDAYAEAFPLAQGYEERVALYQLYPLLAHVNLFGTGYVSQLDQALSHYVG